MKLDRLEVAGGFLDGLAVTFHDGLNVLIGPRGAGKTSVLELIRFALDVPAMTEEGSVDASEQALAVLSDGTVTVYCSHLGESLVFSRTGLDDGSSVAPRYRPALPLIVSQNEIEEIGLDPSSRRDILDRLVDSSDRQRMDVGSRDEVASIERRLDLHRTERDEVAEQTERETELAEALADAEKKQKAAASDTKKLETLQTKVAEMSDELGQVRAAAESYRLAQEEISGWQDELDDTQVDRALPELPSAVIEAQVAKRLRRATEFVEKASTELTAALKIASDAAAENKTEQEKLQKKLKGQTERLEDLQQGAGEVGRRVSALRQELKAVQGQKKRVKQLDKEIGKLTKQRDQLLDELEAEAERRFELRKQCASQLTDRFNGRIEVRVDKSGELGSYESALIELLQGSNLRYKNLAQKLAESISPREFVEAVETQDPQRLTELAGLADDRASKLLAHLDGRSLSSLLLAPLGDSVDFALLDGQEYKVTRNLSMGQRCTVVLPMLLAEMRESILLDQPEDHLDNAFIVETLVAALRERSESGQVVVATHNANIPVLGEARQVVVLASDGRRGFVSSASDLDADASVEAITTLMEGGREAFDQRAAFYDDHPDE